MAADLDRFLEELQRRIDRETRATYSETVIKEFSEPKNVGRLAEPDAHAVVRGWCGDTMEIYLRFAGETIGEATFMTDGCGPTVACGSALTTMVTGMLLKAARRIRPERLIEALGGLPEESVHCAELAVRTLQEAIANRPCAEDEASASRPE